MAKLMQRNKQYEKYMIFALFAIIINIFIQIIAKEISILVLPNFTEDFFLLNGIKFEIWFIFALGSGTLAGFIFKFIVDKLIVFEESIDSFSNLEGTSKQFSLYLGFAFFTTAIFWGFEILFKILFHEGEWYLIGGMIGLIIGYTVKFILDRKYVFQKEIHKN